MLRHAPSIGVRLALLNIAVVVVAMLLVAVVVMWQLSSTFEAEHRRFFADKVAELRTDLVQGHGRVAAVLTEINRETAARDTRQYSARVINVNGQVLGATPGMQTILPTAMFAGIRSGSGAFRRLATAHRDYALTTSPLRNAAGVVVLHLQIALDITRDDRLLTSLRRAVWLTLGFLTVLSVLAAYGVSRRSLAPLRRIVSAARAVTPQYLEARIPMDPPWPRELAELVAVFNAMLARLEDAFTRLSQFSADLAHELRTPLNNLGGATEVCLLRERTGPEYRAALASNLEECRRLTALVENLLFMARAEHAQGAARIETFAGAEACGWVVDQQATAATVRGHALKIVGDTTITADPVLFRQAIGNLVANAIAHAGKPGPIRIELAADATSSTVRVIDQGVGIAPEHLPHLFDRFYRVDAVRSRGCGSGTGLGLAIVKAIVDLHGGSVEMRSAPGVGTCVTLRFPHGMAPRTDTESPHAAPEPKWSHDEIVT